MPAGSQRFPRRYLIYMLAIAYLVGDLHYFNGPLARLARGKDIPDAGSSDAKSAPGAAPGPGQILAIVNRVAITRAELDRAVNAHLFTRGQHRGELSIPTLRQVEIRELEELVSHQVLRMYAPLNPAVFDDSEVDAALVRFRAQFPSEENFQGRLGAAGYTVATLREKLREDAYLKAWIEERIADAIAVSDADIDAFLESNPEVQTIPPSVRVRHIFLSSHDIERGDRSDQARDIAAKLKSGESFAALAEKFSDDERNKKSGGDLGYLTEHRVPEDFFQAIADLPIGSVSAPFQTRLGWHLAEVTARSQGRNAATEEIREEVRSHLLSLRRPEAVKALLRLKFRAHLTYYGERLAGGNLDG